MELKTKKYIKNTGSLPGFADGTVSLANQYGGFQNHAATYSSAIPNVNTNGIKSNIYEQTYYGGSAKNFFNSQTAVKNNPVKGRTQPQTTLAGGKNQSQADSSAAGIHPGFAIGAWLGGGVLEGLNRIKTADQLIDEAGTSEDTIAGITYQKQNQVDADHIMSEYNKQSAADWLTNPARALTGLFGKNRAREEAERAQRMSMNTADAQRGVAYTKALRLEGAKEYGDPYSQYLYSAANGKMPNARVSNGETVGVIDKYTGDIVDMGRVPGRKNNNDTNKVRLPETDRYTSFVLSNKYGLSDQGVYDPVGALQKQKILQDTGILGKERKIKAKNGRLPKYVDGNQWGNIAMHGIGALASLDQILQATRNKPYKPYSYRSNPYELNALTTLAGLRMNPYPVTRQLIDAEGRAYGAINASGGMSTAQRDLGRRASLLGLQKSIADAYAGFQMQDNQYLSDYAKTALNAGANTAQRRMAANQYDDEYYAKSHAARQQGQQMGIYNLLNQGQSYLANANKYNQFKDTMSLYREQLDTDKLAVLNGLEALKKYGIRIR